MRPVPKTETSNTGLVNTAESISCQMIPTRKPLRRWNSQKPSFLQVTNWQRWKKRKLQPVPRMETRNIGLVNTAESISYPMIPIRKPLRQWNSQKPWFLQATSWQRWKRKLRPAPKTATRNTGLVNTAENISCQMIPIQKPLRQWNFRKPWFLQAISWQRSKRKLQPVPKAATRNTGLVSIAESISYRMIPIRKPLRQWNFRKRLLLLWNTKTQPLVV